MTKTRCDIWAPTQAQTATQRTAAAITGLSPDAVPVKVNRVVCATDCGMRVNPDTIQAQMEGGIVYGLTAALYGKITIANGVVEQGNFDDYEMLRMSEMPEVEVYLVDSPGAWASPASRRSLPRSATRSSRPRESGSGSCRSASSRKPRKGCLRLWRKDA